MKKFIYSLLFVFLILFSFNNIFAAKGDGFEVDPIDPIFPDIPIINAPVIPNNNTVSDGDLLNNWFIVENSETQTTMLYTSNDSFYVFYNESTPNYPYLVLGFNDEADWLLYKCYTYDWDTETWIFSGTSSQVYVCSNTVDNPISNITLCNCNIFNEDKMTIFRESGFDYVVTNDNSRIKILPEFSEGFVTCKIDVEIENKQEGEVLYYDDYTSNSTVGDTKKIFPIGTGITITENKSINFYLYDATGNLIDTNSISIYRLVGFNPDCLKINFNFTNKGAVNFDVNLDNNLSAFYDVFFNISDITELRMLKDSDNKDIISNYSNFNKIELSISYLIGLTKMFSNSKDFDLYFKVIDRNSKRIVSTKKYNISLSSSNGGSINSGTITDFFGNDTNMTPSNDSNIKDDIVDVDWSFENSIDNIKKFFYTSKEFFNLILMFLNEFPSWIITPLYTLFILSIIIFVFHAIRG